MGTVTIVNINEIIDNVDELIETHINDIANLLSTLQEISKEYRKLRIDQSDRGFNIFDVIAPTHIYWENLHSDVIKGFLENPGKHNGGIKYLELFIELLNKNLKTGLKIDINDFQNAIVNREKGKIDICIKGKERAIIIENKIKGANDQDKQLPRYYETLKNQKYDVVAIVYLTLHGLKKEPDNKEGWSNDDKKIVKQLLIPIAAYNNENSNDLFRGWLQPCIDITNDIDALCILRQYKKLIQTLNEEYMDNQIMEKFFNTIIVQDEKKYETVNSIMQMLGRLPEYLPKRLEKEFSDETFRNRFAQCIVDKLKIHYKDIDFQIVENFGAQNSGIYFFRENWRNYCIGFSFDSDLFKDFYYGVCTQLNRNIEGNKKHLEELLNLKTKNEDLIAKLKSNMNEEADGEVHNVWPWWKYFDRYRNWNTVDVYFDIKNGKLQEDIKNKIESLLKAIDGIGGLEM